MVKRHLKTLTAPKTWPIKRKGQKFVVRPTPGKAFWTSMPISLVFKTLLKSCKTMKEVKNILHDKEVFIDGKRQKNPRSLIGFMDILSVPESKECYRLTINKNKKLQLVIISDKEAQLKLCKIIGKTFLKKGVVQLNLSDGRNINVKKDSYSVGDSLLLEVPKQKIKESFKVEKGNYAFLIKGKHIGSHGVIQEISKGAQIMVSIKTKDSVFETPKESVFIIGKDKPAIKIEK